MRFQALFGKLEIISSGEDNEEDRVIVDVMKLRCHW